MTTGSYVGENKFVGSGHSNSPWLLEKNGDKWELKSALDAGINKKKAVKKQATFGGEQVN